MFKLYQVVFIVCYHWAINGYVLQVKANRATHYRSNLSELVNNCARKNLVILGQYIVEACLRCCATNRKDSDSIPDGVIGFFH